MKRAIQSELVTFLLKKFDVRLIMLFGSLARNDFRETSDIDLLLVTRQEQKKGNIKKSIPKSLLPEERELGISIYSEDDFIKSYEKGSLFLVHLINEGKILYDDGFFKKVTEKPFFPSKHQMELQLQILQKRFNILKDLKKFNHLFIGVLADYYSIFKNASFNILAKKDKFIFNKNEAFLELSKEYPKYDDEIIELKRLEPFFLRNIKGKRIPYPFNPADENKVIEMRENVRKILSIGLENRE